MSSKSSPTASLRRWWPLALPDWALISALVFGGCCSNVYTLESIVTAVPDAGNLITFAQFVVVSLEGLFRHVQFHSPSDPTHWSWPRLKPRVVPLYDWLVMVVLYFLVSILNNWALAFHISVPLHIVFRSGSLMVNMVAGYLVLGKRYSTMQVAAVALVTAGVVTATLGSTHSEQRLLSHTGDTFSEWLMGIGLLALAMLLIAVLGLYQEVTYRKYNNAWREGLFYNHFLALPLFLPLWPRIQTQISVLNQSAPMAVSVPGMTWVIPSLWLFLSLNVATQYLCATGVNRLTAVATSLTVNLVLNIRKLISLILSVIIFSNPMSRQTMVGCFLVFVGSVIYSQAGRRASPSPNTPTPTPATKKQQ
ncbi:golgi uridine diphosphate-N- acetylglucosamine transporter [Dimargaris cristalligena]|uniref:UAA transporter n=1 Tax=Dimargaris cristalligena TaxID=215637 RepID=A0A4Q0A053_9FUNG|nr:golgi uridine diphosphate-N- acetylglucosamine transporter [Dimargaris cristalligena]RKP39395.1 UAA transporter [Dimargaris cristalligena]|eukprot:RKP39395.1 UAA transporter [Dimargaris cristalligena]